MLSALARRRWWQRPKWIRTGRQSGLRQRHKNFTGALHLQHVATGCNRLQHVAMYLQGRPEQQVPCYLTRLQKPHVQTVMNNLVESFMVNLQFWICNEQGRLGSLTCKPSNMQPLPENEFWEATWHQTHNISQHTSPLFWCHGYIKKYLHCHNRDSTKAFAAKASRNQDSLFSLQRLHKHLAVAGFVDWFGSHIST